MAASRTSVTRPLQQLAKRASSQQFRQLHMTLSPVSSSKASKSSTQDIASDHTREGRRRSFSTSGSDAEPVTTTRSTPNPTTNASYQTTSQTRHFNTSRAHKSPKDTSFIDFAFLPTHELAFPDPAPSIRVPLLPQNFTPSRTGVHAHPPADYDKVPLPTEINTAAADSTHINVPSAMSDVHDNNAAVVDFQEVAEGLEGVAGEARRLAREMEDRNREREDGYGVVRQLWEGMVEDVLGRSRGRVGAGLA